MSRKTGVILSFISIIFEVFSALVLTPYLIKTLGQSEFGVYKMCLSIIAYVLLLDLGIGNSIVRFDSKFHYYGDKESENNLAGISLIFYAIIAVLGLIIGGIFCIIFPYAFSTGLSQSEIILGQKLIVITAITSSITLITSGFCNIIIAHEKYFVSKGVNVIQVALKIVFSFTALKIGWGSIGVCFVDLFLTLFVRMFYVFYVIRILKIRPTFKKNNNIFIKEIISYSTLIAVQMVATQFNQSLDQILIGSLVPDSSSILGVYAVGAQLNQYFMTIGVALTGILMPGIVRFIENNPTKEQLTNEMIRLGRIIIYPLALIFGGLVIFGRQFINIWVGDSYHEAYYVALILIAPQLLVSVCSPCLQVLWALNKQKELTWSKFSIVVINCFLTIILIKWNPLLGASIGTMISVLLGDFLTLLIISKKKLGISGYFYLENTFITPLLTIFSVSIFSRSVLALFFDINSWIKLIISCSLFAVLCFCCLYFCCFNKYEKSLCKKIISAPLKLKKKAS